MSNNQSVTNINKWLIIGMRPGTAGEAVTLGSSNELGANRAVLTSNTDYEDLNPSIIEDTKTNIFPKIEFADGPEAGPESLSRADAPEGLRDVFEPGDDPSENRWFTAPALPEDNQTPEGDTYPGNDDTGPFVDYLPYSYDNEQRQARTLRGVDWSGNVAVTSATGRFSLQDISIFADTGIKSVSNAAADDISVSYYFPYGSLEGLLMNDNAPNPARGWTGNGDFTELLDDLRDWRDFLRNLAPERNLATDIPGIPDLDLDNRNSTDDGQFVYFVEDAWDTNNDGIILIEVPDIGDDFEINNSDWIIEGTGSKLVVFRIRGEANMNISNSSIMLGQQFRSGLGKRKTGVLFVKVHPEEEFTSPSGSSDTVFNLSNVVMNGVGLWDLNTIGDAINDTKYGGNANRTQQGNYTEISHSNTQGCGQFISPFVNMQNFRWMHCKLADPEEPEPSIKIEKYVSVNEGETWEKADSPPGPFLPPGIDPQFKFVVTNTGSVTITDITINDTVLGLIGTIDTLEPGESEEFIVSG